MKALLFAYSQIGVEGLKTLLDLGVSVVGVVSHEDDPREVRWYDSVADLAKSRGIPVLTPANPNTPDMLAWAREKTPDILFSFYYRFLLKKPWLELAPRGAYNLHGSLLPKFRGRACVNWAVLEGATETGVTLHEMVERADAGKILGQEKVSIGDEETARDIFDKLVPAARRLLTRVVPMLEQGNAPRTPQNEAEATTFGARRPDDGRIDWYRSAQQIHNLVRAVTRPYPGAFTLLGGRKLFIWKGRVLTTEKTARIGFGHKPGQILEPQAEGVPVVTGQGVYLVQQAQFEGESEQDVRELLRTTNTLQGVNLS